MREPAPSLNYRRAPEEPGPPEPREELAALTVPVLDAIHAWLGLGRPLRLEVDRWSLDLQLGSGIHVLTPELPAVTLRRLHVDFVDGDVYSDNEGLGPAFDRALTIALCGLLRHALGWEPGTSALDVAAARLRLDGGGGDHEVTLRREFPRVRARLGRDVGLSLEIRDDALELGASRPVTLRIFGLGVAVFTVRYAFATQEIEVIPGVVGPVRHALLRLLARSATRWLRRRLPPALTKPGYGVLTDPDRRAHLLEFARRLGEAGRAGAGAEDEQGDMSRETHEGQGHTARLFSAARAAVAVGLSTLRVSADDLPGSCRVLARIPLGPLGEGALCAERGASVALVKAQGELRLEAPQGIWLHVDQFPELIELRVARARLSLERPEDVDVDVRTEPPLGSFLRAALSRAFARYVLPWLPVQALTEAGVLQPAGEGGRHVLWRQRLGEGRELLVDTAAGATVELRHEDDALVLSAPAGLSVMFEGIPYLPAAHLRRVEYRRRDGALSVESEPALGAFGEAVLSEIARRRVAKRAPAGLGLVGAGGPELAAERLARFSAVALATTLPVVGRLELRLDPAARVTGELGPTILALSSRRGLALVAPDLGLWLEIRDARYALPGRVLVIDAEPAPGDYLIALARLCLEAFVVPALRRLVPLWPDARPDQTWRIGHVPEVRIGEMREIALDLTLPPGARLQAARTGDALELAATAPGQVMAGEGAQLGEFMVEAIRWRPEGERVECVTVPPAGPLLHAILDRLGERFAPKHVLRTLAARLALPSPSPPPPPPPAPTAAPLIVRELPLLGRLCLYVDRRRPLLLALRRTGACLAFGSGLVVRLDELGVAARVRGASLTALPIDVDVVAEPAVGELERWLAAYALRGLLARVLPRFWPGHRVAPAGFEVVLSLAGERPWGPIDLCVPVGEAIELALDEEGLVLRAPGGLTVSGGALAWLPAFTLHEFAFRFEDGAVRLRAGGIEERYYREVAPIGRDTEALLAHLIRVLALPHAPDWAQRLGLRILPPPPPPPVDPARITVFRTQLPGGYGRVLVRMDPRDVLTLRGDRHELSLGSAKHVQIDVPELHLRTEFFWARCHVPTGEVQIGTFGQLENALAEAALRRTLAAVEPAPAEPAPSAVAALLARFPVAREGRRVLYESKFGRLLLPANAALVVRLDERGLTLTADPPLEIDGAATLDYRFGELRYSFDDAAFHLDIERDGVLAGLMRGLVVEEGEKQLGSVLRPLLPARMRRPGYRLATDPDPAGTLAALVRVVRRGGASLAG